MQKPWYSMIFTARGIKVKESLLKNLTFSQVVDFCKTRAIGDQPQAMLGDLLDPLLHAEAK